MKLPHPWPAVIVALVATNLVTAAALVLWSEGRLSEEARWAANREKARDLFRIVTDLGGLGELLEVALNETLAPGVRGDAVANATGPAAAIEAHAYDLADDYGSANASVREVWSGVSALGLSRRWFPDIAREFYTLGAASSYYRAAMENLTRVSRGLQGTLYAIAPSFNASAPLSLFRDDPLDRLSTAEFGALRALGAQAACLYDRLYFGQDLGPCT